MSVPRISSIFKRVLDVSLSSLALLLLLPAILIFSLIIWIQDHGSPIYVSTRVGKDGHIFSMLKLRSMIIDAEKTKVDSTSSDDSRITPIGKFLRKTKLDELPQLWSVLVGDMSLVGPRPNVPREVQLYTEIELELLEIRPGLTDFASIVFADEGEILKGSENPDVTYNQIIRPYKSRLGLFYVKKSTFPVDLLLLLITFVALFSRRHALRLNLQLLTSLGASSELLQVASRSSSLVPCPPPGSSEIVTKRSDII